MRLSMSPAHQTEYLVRDRLDVFLRFSPGDAVADAKSLLDFREAQIRGRALDRLSERFTKAIQAPFFHILLPERYVSAVAAEGPPSGHRAACHVRKRIGRLPDADG